MNAICALLSLLFAYIVVGGTQPTEYEFEKIGTTIPSPEVLARSHR